MEAFNNQQMAYVILCEHQPIAPGWLQINLAYVTIVVYLILIAIEHLCLRRQRGTDHELEGPIYQQVVMIEEHDIPAFCRLQSSVGCRANSTIFGLKNRLDAPVTGGKRLDARFKTLGSTGIINNDQLPVSIGL